MYCPIVLLLFFVSTSALFIDDDDDDNNNGFLNKGLKALHTFKEQAADPAYNVVSQWFASGHLEDTVIRKQRLDEHSDQQLANAALEALVQENGMERSQDADDLSSVLTLSQKESSVSDQEDSKKQDGWGLRDPSINHVADIRYHDSKNPGAHTPHISLRNLTIINCLTKEDEELLKWTQFSSSTAQCECSPHGVQRMYVYLDRDRGCGCPDDSDYNTTQGHCVCWQEDYVVDYGRCRHYLWSTGMVFVIIIITSLILWILICFMFCLIDKDLLRDGDDDMFGYYDNTDWTSYYETWRNTCVTQDQYRLFSKDECQQHVQEEMVNRFSRNSKLGDVMPLFLIRAIVYFANCSRGCRGWMHRCCCRPEYSRCCRDSKQSSDVDDVEQGKEEHTQKFPKVPPNSQTKEIPVIKLKDVIDIVRKKRDKDDNELDREYKELMAETEAEMEKSTSNKHTHTTKKKGSGLFGTGVKKVD